MQHLIVAILTLVSAILAGCLTTTHADFNVCETTTVDDGSGPATHSTTCHLERDPECAHMDSVGREWTAPC